MGHLNIVLLLLQNGASPDVRNIVSSTVITSAQWSGFWNCAQISPVPQCLTAVECCVFARQRGETALHMAARAGQMEVVRCLLRNGALVDAMARVSHLSASSALNTFLLLRMTKSITFSDLQMHWPHFYLLFSNLTASKIIKTFFSAKFFYLKYFFFPFLYHRRIKLPSTLHPAWVKLTLFSCCCSTWPTRMLPPPMATPLFTFQPEKVK